MADGSGGQEVGANSSAGEAQTPHAGPNSNSSILNEAYGDGSNAAGRGFSQSVSDACAQYFYSQSMIADGLSIPIGMQETKIPRSIANKYALFNFKGLYYGLDSDPQMYGGYRDIGSNIFEGGGSAFQGPAFDRAKNVNMTRIINFFRERWPHISYQPSDFLYGKYYKKIPVNHLITLRRFAQPCYDNIYDLKIRSHKDNNGGVDGTQPAGVTAVTYMGEKAGNPLSELLNYSFGLTYEEETAEMESHDTGQGGYTQQPFYSDIGGIGKATADVFKGVKAGEKFRKQKFAGGDTLGTTYANFVLGPVNVVNKTFVRKAGLNFANDLTLNFEYSLKSLAFVNPKLAMIDVMTNMMTMTYNNGQFFGGGHRFYGSGGFVASQFGDIKKLRQGDFSGYVGSVVDDVSTGFSNTFGDSNGNFTAESIIDGGIEIGKQFLGNMLGKFLGENMGSGTGSFATKAFISSEPTGDWHVTIGNPLNPITMMGNMIIDNTTMTLGEGLGADDFPTECKFAITCKHGKPRDKADIENMFNMGRGKIYASPKGEKDILNLAGLDVATYGSVKGVGKTSVTSTGQADGAGNGGAGNTQPVGPSNSRTANVNAHSPGDIDMSNAFSQREIGDESGTNGEYVANMIGMIVDS